MRVSWFITVFQNNNSGCKSGVKWREVALLYNAGRHLKNKMEMLLKQPKDSYGSKEKQVK